ncbi:MAG: type II toxin-antitoxin system RelE/ParE family toxin [Nanoarchaeota archaeon]
MYEVIFDSAALDFLEKCERPLAKRIWNKLMSTKENPHRFFERLVCREDYKLRIGDYRVIVDIDDTKKRIEVTFIGHRKNVYQKV